MKAPVRFADWLQNHAHEDKKTGRVYQYHSRSDSHSIILCELILADLIETCEALRKDGESGKIAYGVNVSYAWPASGKSKTIDLAIGVPEEVGQEGERGIKKVERLRQVLISCEAKAVMTEHSKSQPRVFDELSSSHEIVHRGDINAIAAGVTVVNIAGRFVSPLRQKNGTTFVTPHKQPDVARRMITHLRGLQVRDSLVEQGFDAYCTIVVSCENEVGRPVTVHFGEPAPQAGERDHYDTFLRKICEAYTARFSALP